MATPARCRLATRATMGRRVRAVAPTLQQPGVQVAQPSTCVIQRAALRPQRPGPRLGNSAARAKRCLLSVRPTAPTVVLSRPRLCVGFRPDRIRVSRESPLLPFRRGYHVDRRVWALAGFVDRGFGTRGRGGRGRAAWGAWQAGSGSGEDRPRAEADGSRGEGAAQCRSARSPDR